MLIRNQRYATTRHNYSFDWNGTNEQGNLLSNGMYFYQLDINGRKEVGKVMVVR